MNVRRIEPRTMSQGGPRRLTAWLAGRVPLGDYLAAAERLAWEVGEPGGRGPTLVICEHGDAISIGRSGSLADVSIPHDELRSEGLQVRFVGRGGAAVPHVEGQLTIGLFARLEDLGFSGLDVGGYVGRFEEALAATIRSLRCVPVRRPGWNGLFGRSGLLAAVGIKVRRGVASHGGFLSVSPSMRIVHRVRSSPQGAMGSIERDLQRRVRPSDVRSALVHHFSGAFGVDRASIQSGFPVPIGRPPRRLREVASRVG